MESRLDFIILSILKEQRALSSLSSITLKEMDLENIGYKNNTAQKRIAILENSGKIGKGVKDGHQNTYYITPEGLGLIKEKNEKESDEVNEEYKEGYLIEVSEKIENKEECGLIKNLKRVMVSSNKLIELLKKESSYTVWSAQLIDVNEYKKSNDKTDEWH